MSKVAIEGNALGSGTFTIASPNTNSSYTLTLPDNTGTIITTGSTFAGTGPAFSAYLSVDQTVTNTVDTKVQLNTEVFDTANCFDSTTNYRFTPNVAGYYQFNATVGATATSSLAYNYVQIFKNGVQASSSIYGPYNVTGNYGSFSVLIYMNGTTDYVELYAQLGGTGTLTVRGISSSVGTYMSGFLARAA
jgi:hypothetical protein